MNTDELEARLEGQAETQSLEFKAHCVWDVHSLAKDILALTNVRDGGLIIVGVEDATFDRQGVSDDERRTYDIDRMRDQMRRYADPHVDFDVSYPRDRQGLQYVVIRVSEFSEIPVICGSDGPDARLGVVYYRNRDRRFESAAVSNSFDMKDIVERAAVKMMRKYQSLGLVSQESGQDQFSRELGGL